MTALDWAVLVGTLLAIAAYGAWRTRHPESAAAYLRGGNQDRWHTIGLSVMATQASAITFLSTPGQAYEDGMRFVQFYFGLPLAMVAVSAVMVPGYFRAGVFTAYEFLERRFDLKTRQLAAFLFLLQRGLSAGITIYAPSIILSKVLGWSLDLTNVAMGALVILYTVSGGTRAVSVTQKQQMVVMLGGMAVAFAYVVARLPPEVSFGRAVGIAGALGRMNVVELSFDPSSRYTIWSGLTGGFFLALAYFGTDQSQVQRYLSARSISESRLGLLFNGLFKVPMQFLILLVGVMVFVFHQFERPPLFFNEAETRAVRGGPHGEAFQALETRYAQAFEEKRRTVTAFNQALIEAQPAPELRQALREKQAITEGLRREAKQLIARASPKAETKDSDYIFLSFVIRYLPSGLIGLLLAVIFCAAMSSAASELSALSTTTLVDFYRRRIRPEATDQHYLRAAKLFTVAWGILAVAFATLASLVDNLIQAVNLLGSLFYGTILGIFVTGFLTKAIRGTPVFVAALVSEALVLTLFATSDIGFLWFNVIGCAAVLLLAFVLQPVLPQGRRADRA